jgi:hypothetical protein
VEFCRSGRKGGHTWIICVPLNEMMRHTQLTTTVSTVSLIAIKYHAMYISLFCTTSSSVMGSRSSFGKIGVNAPYNIAASSVHAITSISGSRVFLYTLA